jgi:protein SCO1
MAVRHLGVGAILVVAVLAFGWHPQAARADGDPASDYLLTQQVFFTSQTTSVSPPERELLALARAAQHAGFPIRVAIISNEYDLGSITALWRKPRVYARFLGIELSDTRNQRLLVAMPNGFGFDWPGHSDDAATYRLLAGVPIGSGAGGLAIAAQTAVRRLARAAGVRLKPVADQASHASDGGSIGVWALLVAIVAAIVAAIAVRARRRRRLTAPHTPRAPAADTAGGSPIKRWWAIPGIAALMILAVATPIVVVVALRHGATADANAASVVTPPPFSWAAGRRPAPGFVLRDQNGRRESVAQFRGRPLIVTFVDPLCRNLCPLEAHLLNQVVGSMPAARRPAILAVSVDVYADTRADLVEDEHKWELVPQWHWAIGRPAQLATIWRRYHIAVNVVRKRIGSTRINYITHTEAAYVVDATGHERALFVWPFYPQDVEHVLRELT